MSKNIASGGITQFAPSITLSGTVIDWSLGNVFSLTTGSNPTFTFTNSTDGRTIIVRVVNSSGSNLTVAWPSEVISPDTSVTASKTKIFTFIKIGANVYSNSVEF